MRTVDFSGFEAIPKIRIPTKILQTIYKQKYVCLVSNYLFTWHWHVKC